MQLTREKESEEGIIQVGFDIDPAKYEVRKNGDVIDLTLREYELVKFLPYSPVKFFKGKFEKVWVTNIMEIRTVDVAVRRLRENKDN